MNNTSQLDDIHQTNRAGFEYFQAGRLTEAEAMFLKVIAVDPNNATALGMLGCIADQTGNPQQAFVFFNSALQRNPTDPFLHFNLGASLHKQGKLNDALTCYRQVLSLKPDHAMAHNRVGTVLQQLGHVNEALPYYQTGLTLAPNNAEMHNDLGAALYKLGRLNEAEACYRKALELKPNYAQAHNNLGAALQKLGKLVEALDCYRNALALTPDSAGTYFNLGIALQGLKRYDEVAACYRKVLQFMPNYAKAHNNLGIALQELGRLGEALTSYRKALELDPNYAEAYYNQAVALERQKRFDEAQASYERAIALKPDYIDAYFNLSNLLYNAGHSNDADTILERCLRIDPRNVKARLFRMINCLPIVPVDCAETERGLAMFDAQFRDWAALVEQPAMRDAAAQAVGERQPFYLAYRLGDQRQRLSRFGDLTAGLMAERWPTPQFRRTFEPAVRIRLAIISAHVLHHSVWDVVLRGLLTHLDGNRFETILMYTSDKEDSATMLAKSLVTRFYGGCNDLERCLEIIGQEMPDVIFYPEVGIDCVTHKLANLRLAPLQTVSWGHPITTGLPTIDLFLSGETIEAPNADSHYREKLIRLPGAGACTFSPTIDSEPLNAHVSDLLARARGPRYILCQTEFKFDPAYDALYPRIAAHSGDCRFFLAVSGLNGKARSDRLIERLRRAFAIQGLDPDDYLGLVPWLTTGQFYSLLDQMDVYLDCPAFSGYTTAWQAVHRGVPIVTWEGDFMRQRLAAGVLRQIEQTDTIASTAEEYVEIAVRLAEESRDTSQREMRAAIRAAASRLDNNVDVVQTFEKTLINELAKRNDAFWAAR